MLSLCTMFRVVVTVYALLAVGCEGWALKRPGEVLDYWESIVGGVPASLGEFPSQVSLQWKGRHFCGASILNKEWVLTAAHCVKGIYVKGFSVLAGAIDIGAGEGTVHPVSKIIIHANYGISDISSVNDIAVVKVTVPFDLDGVLRAPVKLPEQDQTTADGANATVIGWGALVWGGAGTDNLQKVVVLITNQEKCNSAYSGQIPPTQICAALPGGGADSCQEDSGGPLFVDGSIVGIVSWGNGCASPIYPGVYTRVPSFRNWIDDNIAD